MGVFIGKEHGRKEAVQQGRETIGHWSRVGSRSRHASPDEQKDHNDQPTATEPLASRADQITEPSEECKIRPCEDYSLTRSRNPPVSDRR